MRKKLKCLFGRHESIMVVDSCEARDTRTCGSFYIFKSHKECRNCGKFLSDWTLIK